jgi:hypothetical protein
MMHRNNKDGSYNVRGYGGARKGAGRKPSGRKNVQFWITEKEEAFLRLQLDAFRLECDSELIQE